MRKIVPILTILLALYVPSTMGQNKPSSGSEENMPTSQSSEQILTSRQWIDLICAKADKDLPRDKNDMSFYRGAALAMGPYTGKPEGISRFNAQDKADYDLFMAFWNDKGRKMMENFLAGQPLSSEDKGRYQYIIIGMCLEMNAHAVQAKKRTKTPLTEVEQSAATFADSIQKNGMDTLRTAYLKSGKSLSADEVESLRLYAMFMDSRCTGGKILPFHLGIASGTGPQIGKLAPDFTLKKLQAGLAEPDYSDKSPFRLVNAIFRPTVWLEMLMAVEGYEPADDGKMVKGKKQVIPPGKDTDYITLKSLQGRPAVLIFADPTDVKAWHWTLAPMLQPIYQAYKDKASFYVIHSTVHDTKMPDFNFFDDPSIIRLGGSAEHCLSVAQRARSAKMLYMLLPDFSIPYLLDDITQQARNAWRDDGGGAVIFLIDSNGIIAWTRGSEYTPNIPFYTDYREKKVNELEAALQALVASGGKYDPSKPLPRPTWEVRCFSKGTLSAVDVVKKTITLAEKTKDGEKSVILSMEPYTRLYIGSWPGGKLEDLKAGMAVEAEYQSADSDKDIKRARWVSGGVSNTPVADSRTTIWLTGHVNAIDAGKRVICVQIDEQVDQTPGYKFWKDAPDTIKAADPEVAARLKIVTKWFEGDNSARTYNLKIDDGTMLFVNGSIGQFNDIKVNDAIGACFQAFQDGKELVYPTHIRISRIP